MKYYAYVDLQSGYYLTTTNPYSPLTYGLTFCGEADSQGEALRLCASKVDLLYEED